MSGTDDRRRPRSRRRGLLSGLGKMARPPLTTPQWKDAVREQELRGPKGGSEDKRQQ